ncbi:MAG: LytTR family transcriptional regulator DNA-binding domain-containing protein [Cyclobacteriaceae bacterium]
MSKPSILIVEDEALIADDMAEILETHGFIVSDIVDEAVDALSSIEKNNPDMALLDINIKGEEDGISLASRLEIPFVFITSFYDQKTIQRASKVNPSGYLVKPFSENELIANVELALSKQKPLENTNQTPEKLFFRQDQEILSVKSDQIVYAEAFDNYTNLFTIDSKYIISHTLKSVEEKLTPLGFVRVHRSYLINFKLIDSISENSVFLMGHKVQISKSYRKNLMDQLTLI